MAELGEIRKGTEIGYKTWKRYIWHACILCGKERWVQLKREEPSRLKCKGCGHLENKLVIGQGGYTII